MTQSLKPNATVCVDCTGSVSYEAVSCPHCGSPEYLAAPSNNVAIRAWDPRLCRVDGWKVVATLELDVRPDEKWWERFESGLTQFRGAWNFPDVSVARLGTRRIEMTGYSVEQIATAVRRVRFIMRRVNGGFDAALRESLHVLLDASPPDDPEG